MRAETVKRIILLSIPDPPEDLEELVELYARLWSRENGEDWRPLREETGPAESAAEGTERVIESTECVIESTENASGPTECVIEPAENVPEPAEAVSGEPPQGEEEPSKDGNAILGFSHIRCGNCGEVKTFCARSWLSKYTCERCGQVTSLRGSIHPAKAVCKCGNRSIYSTNREESAFDIPCVVCGAPMSVVWVPGRDRYDPAGWSAPGGRGRRKKK